MPLERYIYKVEERREGKGKRKQKKTNTPAEFYASIILVKRRIRR